MTYDLIKTLPRTVLRDAAVVLGVAAILTAVSTTAQAKPTDAPTESQSGETNTSGSDAREIRCIAEAVYYEARGESRRGQEAVAEVVANRVKSRAYPNTYCGVVYQRYRSICQFSWACDGRRSNPRGAAWTRAMDIAERVHDGWVPNVAPRATHFHASSVRPSWSRRLPRVTQIGTHIFYRGR